MRTISLVLAISAIVFTTGTGHVAAHDYRYCIQGDEFSGAGDCSFTTLQQCQATASGRMAYCGANLGFSNVAAPNRARSHHHKHAASILLDQMVE
jgi:Protein of unknown function (DUF3551)